MVLGRSVPSGSFMTVGIGVRVRGIFHNGWDRKYDLEADDIGLNLRVGRMEWS